MDDLGRGASYRRLELGLGLCPFAMVRGPWDGVACLNGDAGRLSVSGVGLPVASRQERLVLDAGVGAALNRHLLGPVTLGAVVRVTAPLIRDRIAYATTDGATITVFREPPLALTIGLRLSVAF